MTKDIGVIHELIVGDTKYSKEDGVSLYKDSDDVIWVNRKTLTKIFNVSSASLTTHFKNLVNNEEFEEKEVSKTSLELFGGITELIKDSLINSKKRGRPEIWYNFDVILVMGYRINSNRAIEFRKACNHILKEFHLKGYVIDEERVINDDTKMKMLIEQVHKIRNDVKVLSRRFTDIFTLAEDYDPKSDYVKQKFPWVYNLFSFAVTGETTSEITYNRCDARKPYCGTVTHDGVRLSKSDVINSRNYLTKDELSDLYSVTDATLAQLEFLIRRKKKITVDYICDFIVSQLELLECEILKGYGTVSGVDARQKAIKEYEKFKCRNQTTLDGLYSNKKYLGGGF